MSYATVASLTHTSQIAICSGFARSIVGCSSRSPPGSPGSLTSGGCRYDSSLGMLTKKFLGLIDNAADGILDLNKAAETLKVGGMRGYA